MNPGKKGDRPASPGQSHTQNPMKPDSGVSRDQPLEETEEEESGSRQEEEEESTSISPDKDQGQTPRGPGN